MPKGMTELDADTAEVAYADLRKRERPFVLPLSPETRRPGRARGL